MELFLYWLLRASVLMALFYGLYRLFFANNTFHNVNRFSLIFALLMISVLPLFRFNLIPEKKPEPVTGTFSMDFSSLPITEFVEMQPRVEIPWMQILMILFIAGFIFTVIRYLIGLSQIAAIIRKAEKQTLEDHTVLCITDKNISPFSWMKYIVLSRKELSADNQAVIRHEKAHIRLRHSLDMIFFDVFTCIFWFNPFSWLLRREIQSVHEYQADEQVLNQGIDSTQYQLLLIRKSVGEYKFALANNFRQRDLHKRITMMKKNKTNRRMKWNYMLALPVLFLAMITLSVPELNAKTAEKKNIASEQIDEVRVPEQRVDETADDQVKVMVSGSVHDRQGVIAGALVTIKGTNRGTVTDAQGQFMIETDIGSTLLFSMIDYKTVEYKVESAEKNNLVIVLEPDDAVKATGEGTTVSPQNKVNVFGIQKKEDLQDDVEKVTLRGIGGKHPLYIVDGTPISEAEMQSIKADDIESISIWKEKAAIDMYGDAAKDGVIQIETKKAKKEKQPIRYEADSLIISSLNNKAETTSTMSISTEPNPSLTYKRSNNPNLKEFLNKEVMLRVENPDGTSPLIILDGEKMPKDFELNSIDVKEIESISVLKDKNATEIYGDEGKNGVVIITKKSSGQNP